METDRFALLTNGFCRYSFEYTVKTLAETGIRKTVLWGGIPHCFPGYENSSQLREAEAVINGYGIETIAMYPEAESYPYNLAGGREVRRRTERYYSCCMDFCKRIGIPAIVLHPGNRLLDQEPGEALERAAESLFRLSEEAAEKGLVPLLLHGNGNFSGGCEETVSLLQAAGHPALKIELDLAGLFKSRDTVKDAVRLFGEKIRLVRMSDGPDGHLAVGDGMWPLKEVCSELFESGYPGSVVLQFDSRRYVTDPRKALLSCVREIRTW